MESRPLDDSRLRTLEAALADLVATYEIRPSADLARMIRQLEAEIADRNRDAISPDT